MVSWFGEQTVLACSFMSKEWAWQVIPCPLHKLNNFHLSEVPASCRGPYPGGVHSPMREQTSHQMEGVIKGLLVEITSPMDVTGWIARRGTENIPNSGDKTFSHCYKYVPISNASDPLATSVQRHRGREDIL